VSVEKIRVEKGLTVICAKEEFPAPPPAEKPKEEAPMLHKEEPKRKLKLF